MPTLSNISSSAPFRTATKQSGSRRALLKHM